VVVISNTKCRAGVVAVVTIAVDLEAALWVVRAAY
jgi:hypothetical protein